MYFSIDDPQRVTSANSELEAGLDAARVDDMTTLSTRDFTNNSRVASLLDQSGVGAASRHDGNSGQRVDEEELVRAGLMCTNMSGARRSPVVMVADSDVSCELRCHSVEQRGKIGAKCDNNSRSNGDDVTSGLNAVTDDVVADICHKVVRDAGHTSHKVVRDTRDASQKVVRDTDETEEKMAHNNLPVGDSLMQSVYSLWQQQVLQCRMLDGIRHNLATLLAHRKLVDLPDLDIEGLEQLVTLYGRQFLDTGRPAMQQHLHTSLDSDGRPVSSDSSDSDVADARDDGVNNNAIYAEDFYDEFSKFGSDADVIGVRRSGSTTPVPSVNRRAGESLYISQKRCCFTGVIFPTMPLMTFI